MRPVEVETVAALSDEEVSRRMRDAVVSIFESMKGRKANKKMSRGEDDPVSLFRMYDAADEFQALLFETGSWLAGSYMLQTIVGEIYDDSDIDIFCPSTKLLRLMGFFHERGGAGYDIRGTDTSYRLNSLQGVVDIDFHGKKVQLISVDKRNISKYIDEVFDLSFCKARFDGVRVLPEDLTDICNKRGTLNHRYGNRSHTRVLKYEERGYTISVV